MKSFAKEMLYRGVLLAPHSVIDNYIVARYS